MENQFPELRIEGTKIVASQHVEKGTGRALVGGFIAVILGTLLGILISYGILLIVLLLSPLFAWYTNRKAMALIHGSGIKVDAEQFPEIHRCVQGFSERLSLSHSIDVYIVEANVVNAMAVRYGKKHVVLLTDDLIKGCLYSGIPKALSYVIGHELAHIALKHNGVLRSWMRKQFKKLGRLDEYSADKVALALVGDRTAAFYGLLMLTVGYSMLRYVNPDKVIRQAQEVAGDKYSGKAEKTLTHPLLLNRLNRVLASA